MQGVTRTHVEATLEFEPLMNRSKAKIEALVPLEEHGKSSHVHVVSPLIV